MVKDRTTKRKQAAPRPKRAALVAVALLCLAGIGVSIELTHIHYYTHTDPTFHSVCALSEGVNCETVAQSPWSVFLGVPVSVWGIIGFTLMGALALSALSEKRPHPNWGKGALIGLFTVSVAVSAVLGAISTLRIDSVCLFCLTNYAINFLLFALGIAIAIQSRRNPLRMIWDDVKTVATRPKLLLGWSLPPLLVSAGCIFGITPYWHHPGWDDLPPATTGVAEDGTHWLGAKSPELTIVEFSDYQCPHCRRAHKGIRILAGEYPGRVRIVHRHMPLDDACNKDVKRKFHERACEFSKAVECAGQQHKFWEMSDAIFSLQDSMKAAGVDLNLIAVQLGINVSEFKSCMASDEVMARIEKDLDAARALKIEGTPTFLIDDQAFPGSIPAEVLSSRLGKPTALPPSQNGGASP